MTLSPGPRPPLSTEDARELLVGANARAAMLVEGWSDQAALESLARKRDRDLSAEGIAVVPIGGITNIGKFAEALGPRGGRSTWCSHGIEDDRLRPGARGPHTRRDVGPVRLDDRP